MAREKLHSKLSCFSEYKQMNLEGHWHLLAASPQSGFGAVDVSSRGTVRRVAHKRRPEMLNEMYLLYT